MTTFEKFFGINPDKIKKNCIICPANDASLFTEKNSKTSKGIFFKINNSENTTIISVKNNFLISDCILLLIETPCENIFLFGPCGALSPFNIGDKLLIEKAFNFESSSSFIDFPAKPCASLPNKELFDKFHSFSKLKTSACATTSSLILEKLHIPKLKDLKISSLDMETSIVFFSAEKIEKKALAVLYITDTPEKAPLFTPLKDNEKEILKSSRKELAQTLQNFITNQTNEI